MSIKLTTDGGPDFVLRTGHPSRIQSNHLDAGVKTAAEGRKVDVYRGHTVNTALVYNRRVQKRPASRRPPPAQVGVTSSWDSCLSCVTHGCVTSKTSLPQLYTH
ncbi:hypothetical protein PoB_005695800 [Plakobranchus ocellatus]|uniref:Uncharacterized protein n=1 Tax=Plakobranchus ocellatus TaxID=259542 RepID=A0AAV4CG29_9GAST|nr:hypothetical protein PoB_005695800 [Plakobranchus ocellatus]